MTLAVKKVIHNPHSEFAFQNSIVNRQHPKIQSAEPGAEGEQAISFGVQISDRDHHYKKQNGKQQSRNAKAGAATGVCKFYGYKMQDAKNYDEHKVRRFTSLENKNQVKNHEVPKHRKTDEIIISGYHPVLSVIDHRNEQDQSCARQFPGFGHQISLMEKISRDNGVGGDVHYKVHGLSIHEWQNFFDFEHPGKGTVDPVDNQAEDQPEHRFPPVLFIDRQDRHKSGDHPGSRENVDCPGQGFLER